MANPSDKISQGLRLGTSADNAIESSGGFRKAEAGNTLRPLPPPGPPPRPRRALKASSSKYAWELTRTGNTVPLEHSLSQRTSFGAKQKKKATSVFSSPARHLPPPGAPPSTANQCAPSPILFPPEQLHRRPGTQAHPRPPPHAPAGVSCQWLLCRDAWNATASCLFAAKP